MGNTCLTLFIVEIVNFVLKTKSASNMRPHTIHKLRKSKHTVSVHRVVEHTATSDAVCMTGTILICLHETIHLISIAWVSNYYYCCSTLVNEMLLQQDSINELGHKIVMGDGQQGLSTVR